MSGAREIPPLCSAPYKQREDFAMALSSRQSRRDVLKLTAYSTAGALLGAPTVRAQTKSLTMMHESSFVPPYDAFFKNKLATAYEKAKGIKVNYEVVSV